MDSIYQKIKTNLDNLRIKNCSILIALSGGMDSMALLYLLLKLKDKYKLKLYAAYVNHNLRDINSDIEELFIIKYTKKLKIKLYKYTVPKDFWKDLKNQSIEMAARKIRYQFFKEIINHNKIDYIATAHNFNDKIESFFLQIFRGGGFDSLKSIPIKNKKIIRPILNVTRDEIKDYIDSNKISYIHDYTNDQNIYKRNIIRNKLFPIFKEIHPNFEKSFSYIFQFIDEEFKLLNYLSIKQLNKILLFKSDEYFCLDKNEYSKLPSIIQKNIIKLILKKIKYPAQPNINLLNSLSGNKKKYIYKNKYIYLKSSKKFLWIINLNNLKSFDNIFINKIPYNYKNEKISISLEKSSDINPKQNFCFKYEKSIFPLLFRKLNPDDNIIINNNKKNIIKILNEKGYPEPIHKKAIIIETNNNKIIGFFINNFNQVSNEFYINNDKANILLNVNFVNT
jgi:tRNA(Ile)-lysidine synthase